MVIQIPVFCRSCRLSSHLHCFYPQNSQFVIDIDRCSHTTICGAFYLVVSNIVIPKMTEVILLERSIMVDGTSSERRIHFFETLAEFLTPELKGFLGLTEASVTTITRLQKYLGSLARGDQAEISQVFTAMQKAFPSITDQEQEKFRLTLDRGGRLPWEVD